MKKFLLTICLGLACLRGTTRGDDDKKAPVNHDQERRQKELVLQRKRAMEAAVKKYAEAQALLRVDADSDACVAEHNQRGACLVTARDFNRAVGLAEPDDGLGSTAEEKRARIRGTRRDLLRQMLQGEYLADELKATGLENEVIRRAQEADKRKWNDIAKRVGEAPLRELYRRFAENFAARESRVYQVAASTDSLWVDSLSKLPPPAATDPGAASWAIVGDSLMPPELDEAGRTLKKPKSALTLPWKAGYACIRLVSVRRTPAVPFQQALPTLVSLMPYLDLDPDSLHALQNARKYYADHPAEFRRPDTLDLDVALVPGMTDSAGTEKRQPPPRRLESPALPEQARLWLAEKIAQPKVRDSLKLGRALGPVFLGVGTWTFRVDRIRKGIGSDDFEHVRDSLEARLLRVEHSRGLAEVQRGLAEKNRSLGMSIFLRLMEERETVDRDELEQRIKADSTEIAAILSPDMPPQKVRENQEAFARARIMQDRRDKSYDAWLRRSVTLAGIDPE